MNVARLVCEGPDLLTAIPDHRSLVAFLLAVNLGGRPDKARLVTQDFRSILGMASSIEEEIDERLNGLAS